jgi:hypothetical protein
MKRFVNNTRGILALKVIALTLFIGPLSCSPQKESTRKVFESQEQLVRATQLALAKLRDDVDANYKGEPPKCELMIWRNEETKAWTFRFIFLPKSTGNDATISVRDDGTVEYKGSLQVFQGHERLLHATESALVQLQKCSDATYTGKRNCEIEIRRNDEVRAWIFWFIFLPKSPDYETMVTVRDNGTVDCF